MNNCLGGDSHHPRNVNIRLSWNTYKDTTTERDVFLRRCSKAGKTLNLPPGTHFEHRDKMTQYVDENTDYRNGPRANTYHGSRTQESYTPNGQEIRRAHTSSGLETRDSHTPNSWAAQRCGSTNRRTDGQLCGYYVYQLCQALKLGLCLECLRRYNASRAAAHGTGSWAGH